MRNTWSTMGNSLSCTLAKWEMCQTTVPFKIQAFLLFSSKSGNLVWYGRIGLLVLDGCFKGKVSKNSILCLWGGGQEGSNLSCVLVKTAVQFSFKKIVHQFSSCPIPPDPSLSVWPFIEPVKIIPSQYWNRRKNEKIQLQVEGILRLKPKGYKDPSSVGSMCGPGR